MTDAFRCDGCGEYHDGSPDKTLYEKDYDRGQNEIYTEVGDFCETCWAALEAGEGVVDA